ncbi:hypothetical protein CHCC20327_1928 [Bacillus licheniformis]|nr:hypothetical protein CHCC20487_4024 [Bacillus licheniformis]TWK90551.1 hypothetical protein CHCC20327_1928 [Bacillus licheniformis]
MISFVRGFVNFRQSFVLFRSFIREKYCFILVLKELFFGFHLK